MDNKYLIVMFDEEQKTFARMSAETDFEAYRLMMGWVQREIDHLELNDEIKWKLTDSFCVGLKDGNTIAANVDLVSAELHPTGRNSMYWRVFEV